MTLHVTSRHLGRLFVVGRNAALRAFGEKKPPLVLNILPIFNPAILNFELFYRSATLSKLKSTGLDKSPEMAKIVCK